MDTSKCLDCEYHYVRYGRSMCIALNTSKPAEYMRDEKSECGPEAKLFDPKQKQYAEYAWWSLFSLQRPNVLSFGDLAIIRGLRMIYRHKTVDRKRFEAYRRRFSPYGSVASLYLWAVAGGALPEYGDPAWYRDHSRISCDKIHE